MADTFIEKDNTYVFETISNKNGIYLRSLFKNIKQFVDNINEELPNNIYYYIAGGYLRDSVSNLNRKDIDIFSVDNYTKDLLNKYIGSYNELIYESTFVNRYKNDTGVVFDVSKLDATPHEYIYNCDFINSCIVYDSNHDIFYHEEFVELTKNKIIKPNASFQKSRDVRGSAFRLGKFYERGYDYHTGNVNDYYDEVEELKKQNNDIKVIKLLNKNE